MSRPYAFNIDTAIATWRRALESARWVRQTDADELESHIRDHVRESDLPPEQAFREVLTEMGQYHLLESEFGKVYWGKLLRQRRVGSEMRAWLSQIARESRLALRNAGRHPGYTALTVLSLAVGIGCAVIVTLFVRYEMSFDDHHSKADSIVRIVTERTSSAGRTTTVDTPLPLAPTLQEKSPLVESATRFDRLFSGVFTAGDRSFHESDVYFADPTVFEIFDIEFVEGSPDDALATANSVVITEEMARKYFGDEPAVGEVMTYTYEGTSDYVVRGVVRAQPVTSHFHFDFLVPVPDYMAEDDAWDWDAAPTYVLLDEQASPDDLEEQLAALIERQTAGSRASDIEGAGANSASSPGPIPGPRITFSLQPLTSIHLHSRLEGEHEANGSMPMVLIMVSVGLMILFIACINFVNLATARATARAREVGVRKALGISRNQLFRQFVGESVLTALISSALGLLLVSAFLPVFNGITGAALHLDVETAGFVIPVTAGLSVLIGMLAGLYPAFVLSAFNPVHILKGRHDTGGAGGLLRRSLVVAQFAVGAFILVGLMVVRDQMNYVTSTDPGYDVDQLVYIRSPQRRTPTPYEAIKSDLGSVPGVVSVAGAGSIPGTGMPAWSRPVGLSAAGVDNLVESAVYFVHPDFFETFDLEWVDRPASLILSDSSRFVIINEAAAMRLGLDEPSATPEIELYLRDDRTEPTATLPIAGRLKDIHFESFHTSIRPMVMIVAPVVHTWTYIALRVDSNDLSATLAGIEDAWLDIAPEWPAQISFMDEQVEAQYVREARIGSVFSVFSLIAMVLAGLGLAGLATFSMQRRRKEIGIRKVLGADVKGLVMRMSAEYVGLAALSLLIALPPAWLVATAWLDRFAYRVDIQPLNILAVGGIVVVLTFLCTSVQVIRASSTDPVVTLRTE